MAKPSLSWAVSIACLLALIFVQASAARVHHRRLLGSSSVVQPSCASTYSGFCAIEGPAASSTFMNASRTCLKLHSSGAPIQVPTDTNATKWGQIFIQNFEPLIASFIDRHGNNYPISPSANPPTDSLQLQHIWTLLVVKAELTNGNVTSFTPVLYVPYSTIMATMAGTQFEGQLINANPRPVGPNATSYFRWTFGDRITVTNATEKYGTLLHGTFDNLFTPVQDSKGKCQPALCADPTRTSDACKYYIKYFGNSTAITLNWDPNMHTPTDTELVPMFPATSRQYMAEFIELYDLMSPRYKFVPRKYTFIGHGTPLAVPQDFVGVLSPAKKVVKCKAA